MDEYGLRISLTEKCKSSNLLLSWGDFTIKNDKMIQSDTYLM